ncbi:hypothetical protein OG937_25815 [Streptomyces sp. NBC_00510]
MGIFRRGPKRDQRDAPRDPEYAFFSVDEGARFRAIVRESFAELGLEVTVFADMVTDDSGRRFGLGNLAALCHNDRRGPRVWPLLAREHIGAVLRTLDGPSPLETLPAEEIRERLYPRLVTPDAVDPETFRYARVAAPGLLEVLALDLPESVMTLADHALVPLGDARELRGRALLNLRDLPVERHEVVRHADVRFDVLVGDSFFTAARVLVLDELVERVTGEPLTADGALVAMPFRHQLAFHAIRDSGVIPALNGMAGFAAAGHEDAVGPISPYVYWWRDGVLTQLSRKDGDGLLITVGEEFQDVLERLVPDQAGEER